MTTYFQPLQRESDKRWDMTSRTNSTGSRPIGYCAGWKEVTREELEKTWGDGFLVQRILDDQEKFREHQHKYHTDGHESPEEANKCYDTFLLDSGLEFRRVEDEQHRCACCGEWGQITADIRGYPFGPRHWLCNAHANRGDYEPVFFVRHEKA